VYTIVENADNLTIEESLDKIAQKSNLLLKIEEYNTEIEHLIEQRSKIKPRITITELPQGEKHIELKSESKGLKNAVLMLVYRADTRLDNSKDDINPNKKKEGRMI